MEPAALDTTKQAEGERYLKAVVSSSALLASVLDLGVTHWTSLA